MNFSFRNHSYDRNTVGGESEWSTVYWQATVGGGSEWSTVYWQATVLTYYLNIRQTPNGNGIKFKEMWCGVIADKPESEKMSLCIHIKQ